MKNMSAWAIRHPIAPLVLFVVLTFCGVVAFLRLPITLQPDVSFPYITVTVLQPGAAPTEMESQIIQKVEAAVAGVGDVRSITSVASEGDARVYVEFQVGTPVDRALNDVRDAVSKVRSSLPEGIDEPTIQRTNAAGGAIAYFAVSDPAMSPQDLAWFIDNTISKRLLALPGVAQIQRSGGVDRELRIELDPGRLQALGITAVQVNQQLRTLNLDAGGGRADVAGGEQAIRVLGGAHTAAELADTRIPLPGGRSVRLRDIANVHDGAAEVRALSRLDGKPATTFGVLNSKGSSDVTVLEAVHAELAGIERENPAVRIVQVYTSVDNTLLQYHSAMRALFEGALLAVVVVWFFLRNGRATAISALAIPLSAIPTFFFMELMGFSLNGISLLALSLVAGILVDDAIVEIENIVRHMRMGKTPYRAALDAADEIGLAVVATSATIIVVFLPVSFMGGMVGQYFRAFGLTVAAAVFFSLLVARLVTPVIAAYALRPDALGSEQAVDGPLMRGYLRALEGCIRHRWATVGAGVLFFALSVVTMALLPKGFLPDTDLSSPQLHLELPPGVPLAEMARISGLARDIVRRHPEVTTVIESIGGDELAGVDSAALYIQLVPVGERKLSQKQWERMVAPELAAIPDARVYFQSQDSSGLGRDVDFYLTGEDRGLLERTARQVVAEMQGIKELREPRINGDLERPEIVIRPRLDLAASLGVTVASIGQTIRIATLGELPQNAAKFSLADRQIPIRVSLTEEARRDLATIENLPVPTAAGGSVPLKSVADIRFGQGPTTVRRYDQSPRVMLEADLPEGAELGTAMQRIEALPSMRHLPAGLHFVPAGNAQFMQELFGNFLLAIGAGVLMVLAVLVLLFARVFQPFTILSALPLSLGGAALALTIAGFAFSLPVVIGILMLMGIVGKNSILLVDFAIESRRAGRDRLAALIEAGHKRARPIVMTTVAMVAGMIPVAFSNDAFRQPMAIAVIGGLITSTALTLVIVPAVFTLVDDLEAWVAPRAARLLGPRASDASRQAGVSEPRAAESAG
jgi:multidrug efflux pump subunit AcrB